MTQLQDLKNFKGHTLLFWNARSLMPRLEEIQRIIDLGNPEILCISETWLNSKIDDPQIAFDKYIIIRSDRTAESKKKGGGGLVIYYKDDLDNIYLTEHTKCTPDIECIWVGLKLVNTKLIVIGLVYRPPSGRIDKFIEVIEETCLALRSQRNCEINFGGDVNIDFNKKCLQKEDWS